jgi:hypothetical protein
MLELSPSGSETVGVDRDDIFGLRRAWAALPEQDWERFLAQWVQLTESCGYHVPSIEALAAVEAEHWRDLDPAVAQAWSTISAAMSVYLAWKDAMPGAES